MDERMKQLLELYFIEPEDLTEEELKEIDLYLHKCLSTLGYNLK